MRTHVPPHPAAAMLHAFLFAAALLSIWLSLVTIWPDKGRSEPPSLTPSHATAAAQQNAASGLCYRAANTFSPVCLLPAARPFGRRPFSHWT